MFRNDGPITAKDVRIISASSTSAQIPNPALEQQMIAALRAAADSQRKQPHSIGAIVEPGYIANIDVTIEAITPEQAHAIVAGTGRIYEYVWIGWTDKNGKNGEQEYCAWMQKPESKQLTLKDISMWVQAYLPPKPQ